MKICVVIPAYNEAQHIGLLVRDVLRQGMAVVVSDDGSGDATTQIARQEGAMVLTQRKNQGKG